MKHPHQERTFVILKPDTVQRSLMGEVIRRFERTGLKCTAMKMINADEARLLQHYNKDDAWFLKKGTRIIEDMQAQGRPVEKEAIEYGKDIIRTIVHYMEAAPAVVMVWEGNEAVAVVTKLVGTTLRLIHTHTHHTKIELYATLYTVRSLQKKLNGKLQSG
jgi:nucleoside-diphosphate kinase